MSISEEKPNTNRMKQYADRYPSAIFALSGAVSALPFLWPQLFLLSWVAFVPAIYLLFCGNFSAKRYYCFGLLRGYIFFFLLYSWFIHLYPLDFLGMSRFQSILVVVIAMTMIPLLHAAITAFAFPVVAKFANRRPFVAAAVFTLSEFLLSVGTLGFPWARLAITQTSFLPILQSAELFGGYGIAFLIFTVNALIALVLIDKAKRKRLIAVALILFTCNILYGTVRLLTYPQSKKTIHAGIIQGNIDPKMKWESDSVKDIGHRYAELTAKAIEKAEADGKPLDLIVYPETAIPVTLAKKNKPLTGDDKSVCDLYVSMAETSGIPFLVGAYYEDSDDEYNSVYLIKPDGEISEPYHKRHPVPFGEYLPYRAFAEQYLPFAAQLNALGSDLSAGDDTALFHADFGKIGALVCFDSIFDALSREGVRDGANIIAIVTNDAWYKDSPAVYQHNAHAILRAVENRRSVLRAANTGISSVIFPTGAVRATVKPLVNGSLTETVPLSDKITPYTRFGNLVLWLCVALFLWCMIEHMIQWKQNRRQ